MRTQRRLEKAAERSTQVGDEGMADEVRWIRSYVLDENGGSVSAVVVHFDPQPAGT